METNTDPQLDKDQNISHNALSKYTSAVRALYLSLGKIKEEDGTKW